MALEMLYSERAPVRINNPPIHLGKSLELVSGLELGTLDILFYHQDINFFINRRINLLYGVGSSELPNLVVGAFSG